MKNTILTICHLACLLNFSISQISVDWQSTFGGSDSDQANSIIQTKDGGFLVVGWTTSRDGDISNPNYQFITTDYWILKLDPLGNIEWEKTYGGEDTDIASSVVQLTDEGYLIAGDSNSDDFLGDVSGNKGGKDYWIIRLDSQGNLLWEKSYGGEASEFAQDIKATPDGGFVVVGSSFSNGGDVSNSINDNFMFETDYWVVKANSEGEIQWEKSLGGNDFESANSVLVLESGEFIIAGGSNSKDRDVSMGDSLMGSNFWIVKLDTIGNIIWETTAGTDADDGAFQIRNANDGKGGFIVSGYSEIENEFGHYSIKINKEGEVIWETHEGGIDFVVLEDNSLLFVKEITDGEEFDFTLTKTDSGGVELWSTTLGGSDQDQINSLEISTDGGIIMAGYTFSQDGDIQENKGDDDIWVVKLSSLSTVTSNIKELNNSYLTMSSNPAYDHVQISLNGKQDKQGYEITIIDYTGRIIHYEYLKEINDNKIPVNYLKEGIYLFNVSGLFSNQMYSNVLMKN